MIIRQLTNLLGAEITGIDLRKGLEPIDIDAIGAAWKQHRVLVFPQQAIEDAQQAEFAGHFGPLARFEDKAGRSDAVREIYRAANADDRGRLLPSDDEQANLLRMNWCWHVDACYRSMPTKGIVLRCIEVADDGGDTIFANMEAAYTELPAATKRRIAGLVACHNFAYMVKHCGLPRLSRQESARLPAIYHPLVWQHADGRKSLFLSPPYMEAIVGLDSAASSALIEELTEWSTRERFLYRHRWCTGDLLMWDNRWTMHKVSPYDLVQHKRVMHGATLLGTETVGGFSNV